MKIDTDDIRSVEIIEKPDGRYIRIGYAKPESITEKGENRARDAIRKAWKKRVVKAVVIAIIAGIIAGAFRAVTKVMTEM